MLTIVPSKRRRRHRQRMHSPVLLSAETRGSPLGLQEQQLTGALWPWSTLASAASCSVFHRYTSPSLEPDAICLPSGLKQARLQLVPTR